MLPLSSNVVNKRYMGSLRRPVSEGREIAVGLRGKAGYSQRLATGELTSYERESLCGMAQTITAEPRQPL
jgi:hypothetical protein